MFTKWPSIENSYQEKNISWWLQYYPALSNESYVVTEKLHGCLQGDSRIRMADGSWKYIRNINVGDMLLGFSNGTVAPCEVTNTYRNGISNNWLNVTGTRNQQGGNKFSIFCTPEHEFYSPKTNSYILARELKVGDRVLTIRSDLSLSPLQEQIILGKLLGDGYLHIAQSNYSASLTWGHSEKQKEYVLWTAKALGGIVDAHEKEYNSGYGSIMYRNNTVFSAQIYKMFSEFYKDDKKCVPPFVETLLTPISLAVWYMDDGSLSHNSGQEDRATFATNAFTVEDCKVLIKGLARLGVTAEIKNWGDGNRIMLNADNAERMFLLISPYIPMDMQYKLPQRYRGCTGWLPPLTETKYKRETIEQVITSIEVKTYPRGRETFDLETTTHNYFAHDVLVHNSNFQWFLQPNEPILAGSRNGFINMAGSFQGVVIDDLLQAEQSLLTNLQNIADNENVTLRLFGELFGGNIQKGVKYGPDKRLLYFGIMVNDVLQPFKTLEDYIPSNKIVPIVDIVESLDAALEVNQKFDSLVLNISDNIVEGIVIMPYAKVYAHENGGTFILKNKNVEFSEKAHAPKPKVDDPTIVALNKEFLAYITDNRLQNIFSQYGVIEQKPQISKYLQLLIADAKEDFMKDFDVAELNTAEQKQVFNVGSAGFELLKVYL